MELFGWTLTEINETDIEDLIPFVFEYPKFKERHKHGVPRQLFADQAEL